MKMQNLNGKKNVKIPK